MDSVKARIAMRIKRIFMATDTSWDKKGGWIEVTRSVEFSIPARKEVRNMELKVYSGNCGA